MYLTIEEPYTSNYAADSLIQQTLLHPRIESVGLVYSFNYDFWAATADIWLDELGPSHWLNIY